MAHVHMDNNFRRTQPEAEKLTVHYQHWFVFMEVRMQVEHMASGASVRLTPAMAAPATTHVTRLTTRHFFKLACYKERKCPALIQITIIDLDTFVAGLHPTHSGHLLRRSCSAPLNSHRCESESHE